MLSDDQKQFLDQPLRIMRIIGFALTCGVLGFGLVAVLVPKDVEPVEVTVAKIGHLVALGAASGTAVPGGPILVPTGSTATLTPRRDPNTVPVISLAAAIAAAGAVVVSVVVSKLVAAQSIAARQRVDADALSVDGQEGEVGPVSFLTGVYQSSFITGAAVLEGVAFFNLVAHLTEGQMFSVAAAAVMLVGIWLMIPTRSRLEAWVEDRLREHSDNELLRG